MYAAMSFGFRPATFRIALVLTGISRERLNLGHGEWWGRLAQVLSQRASNREGTAVEPGVAPPPPPPPPSATPQQSALPRGETPAPVLQPQPPASTTPRPAGRRRRQDAGPGNSPTNNTN